MKLTKPQVALLECLDISPNEAMACERACHPNTAAALERRGLLTIEDGDGSFRPWFDCQITPQGRAALGNADSPGSGQGPREATPDAEVGPGTNTKTD